MSRSLQATIFQQHKHRQWPTPPRLSPHKTNKEIVAPPCPTRVGNYLNTSRIHIGNHHVIVNRQLSISRWVHDATTMRSAGVARAARNSLRWWARPPKQVELLRVQPSLQCLLHHSVLLRATPESHTKVSPTTDKRPPTRTASGNSGSSPHATSSTDTTSPVASDTKLPQQHTSSSPAVITELTPHTGTSTPDTTVTTSPPDNIVSPTRTTMASGDTLSRSHRHTLTAPDTTVSTPLTSVSPPPDTLSRSHRPPLTAPDTVSTPLASVSPPPDTLSRSHRPPLTAPDNTVSTPHNSMSTDKSPTDKFDTLPPTGPLKAGAAFSTTGHICTARASSSHIRHSASSRTTINGLSADLNTNLLNSCRTHPSRTPTTNWCFSAPSPRTTRAWRSAIVGAAPSMRWCSRMRALLCSARVSPSDCIRE